jgi:hypothetical protein
LEQLTKPIVKTIDVVFLIPGGEKYKRQFKTEEEAAEYLKVTHATEAPLSFTYGDGTPLNKPALERIQNWVFESFHFETQESQPNDEI